jgi:hypothetical protein
MARTFPEHEHDNRVISDGRDSRQNSDNQDNRPVNGNGKVSAKNKPKPRKPGMNLVQMQAGLNVRVFTHERRLVFLILHARADHVDTATRQVDNALKTGKTCLISASKGYKCLLFNLHASLLATILTAIFCAGNPELVKQIVMMVFNVR